MKFLIDNALSPVVAERLSTAGHDVVHDREGGLQATRYEDACDRARHGHRVIVSAGTDFGTLLAARREPLPCVLLFHRGSQRKPDEQAELLVANLAYVAEDLTKRAVVVIEPGRCESGSCQSFREGGRWLAGLRDSSASRVLFLLTTTVRFDPDALRSKLPIVQPVERLRTSDHVLVRCRT